MFKIVISVVCAVLAVGVAVAQQATHTWRDKNILNGTMMTTNLCWPEGGMGIINTSLFIVVKSPINARNELLVKSTYESELIWKGKDVTSAEVVVFYEGKVWSTEKLSDHFDMSRAIVISFENDKVRFFDFQKTFGGCYNRLWMTNNRY